MKNPLQSPMTIGAMLAAARERQNIPIERAAKDSRIRVQRLREIEQDDFSELTNASYARMFLIAYAKYLGIPREDLDVFLPDRGLPGAENYDYIQRDGGVLPTIRYQPKPPPSARKRWITTIITVTLVVLLLVGGGVALYLAVNLPRLSVADAALLTESVGVPDPTAPTPTPVPPVEPPGQETVRLDPFGKPVSIVDPMELQDAEDVGAPLPNPVSPEFEIPTEQPPAASADPVPAPASSPELVTP